MSDQIESVSTFQRLMKIGNCLLQHRRMSSQEASYRLGNFYLVKSSRKNIYVNTRVEEKRFKRLKTKLELAWTTYWMRALTYL